MANVNIPGEQLVEIKLCTTYACADGCHRIGEVIQRPLSEALELVARSFAVFTNPEKFEALVAEAVGQNEEARQAAAEAKAEADIVNAQKALADLQAKKEKEAEAKANAEKEAALAKKAEEDEAKAAAKAKKEKEAEAKAK